VPFDPNGPEDGAERIASGVVNFVNPSAIIFDGDDTLWWTERLYDEARLRAARHVTDAGLDAAIWDAFQRQIDVENVSRLGLSRRRFPTSCVEAYDRLVTQVGIPLNVETRDAIWSAADSVFSTPASVVVGAVEVLQQLSSLTKLALLTRGDVQVQEARIAHCGLAKWFRDIHIVDEKSSEQFAATLRTMGATTSTAWSVGNSRRSDIDPALAIGMRAIWIDAHVWEYERRFSAQEHDCLFVASSILEVPAIVLAG
jgi:putative hydrolase of the HAD superfamily